MAGGEVAGLMLLILGRNMLADLLGIGAAGMEPAALGRIGGAGKLTYSP